MKLIDYVKTISVLILIITAIAFFWKYIVGWIYDVILSVIYLIFYVITGVLACGVYYCIYKTISSFYHGLIFKGFQYLLILFLILILFYVFNTSDLLDLLESYRFYSY